MPETTETERSELVIKALAEANARPNAERIRLGWRSSHTSATVVELPVDKVVLNPRSHRIRSQLESSPHRELVINAPFSEEAQAVIEDLLRQAEEFADLRVNLAEVGQIEPGVVTADGMLINANTRCVALRDNGVGNFIRAGVLPSDASREEIDRLELRLQMKHDFQSDYTFTNELLFLDDLAREYHYSAEQIAIEMGWAARSDQRALKRMAEQVQSYTRMLTLIREIQHMSDGKIPTVYFDGSRQALIELDREVEARKSNYREAREIRDARMVGILAGAGYRELREIGPDFVSEFLVPAMHDRPTLSPHVDVLTSSLDDDGATVPEGLELFDDEPAGSADEPRRSAAALLNLLTRDPDSETIELSSRDGEPQNFNRKFFNGELKTAIEGAAEDVRLNREAGDLLGRPRDLIRKATKHVQAAADAYRDVADHPELDRGRLRQAAAELAGADASFQSLIEGDDGA